MEISCSRAGAPEPTDIGLMGDFGSAGRPVLALRLVVE